MRLPHERDESVKPLPNDANAEAKLVQAENNVERGQVDTDRRGTPNDVP